MRNPPKSQTLTIFFLKILSSKKIQGGINLDIRNKKSFCFSSVDYEELTFKIGGTQSQSEWLEGWWNDWGKKTTYFEHFECVQLIHQLSSWVKKHKYKILAP